MDAALKFFILAALTALIMAANISIVRVIMNWWQGGNLAIGTFVIVQPPKDIEKLSESLGQLLHAELKNTVSQIRKITLFARSSDALTISQPPIRPTDLSIKIGTVEVSGIVSWLQSLFISEKTLNFVISFDKDKAVVAGDISALSKRQSYLHFEIADPTPRKISSRLAYALYQAQMGESDDSEATALDPADFGLLIEALGAVQDLDRQAGRKIIIRPDQYTPYLDKISSVAGKTPTWRQLVETEAVLAFAAQRYDQARQIYSKFLEMPDLSRGDRQRYLTQMERLKELAGAAAPARVVLRRNLSSLNENELQELRAAFRKLYADNTNDGYKIIADIYRRYVQMNPTEPDKEFMFLAWNRAYLAYFETALRRVNSSLSVPYWDWSERRLPLAVQGNLDNPLAAGPVRLISADGKVLEERSTTRDKMLSSVAELAAAQDPSRLLSIKYLRDFENVVWNYHNMMHVWVGGDMARTETTAFDPLFWFLQANVDRLWVAWEAMHSDMKFSDSVLDRKLEPFVKTVRDVLNTDKLAYKY